MNPAPTPASLPGAAARAELRDLLDRLAELLSGLPGVLAVVLMGSAARDELAACEIDGRLQLFSDLELLVISERRLPAELRMRAQTAAQDLARRFAQASPLFHIDLLFRERGRLAALPAIVFTFELREAGRILRGPNLLTEIPALDAERLDQANTREILFKRLWALAEALPAAWLRGEPLDPVAARSLGVSLRRNPLDVPTVLLPACGVLEAGYRQRGEIWRAHPELPCRAWIDRRLGQDSAAFLDACLAERSLCAAVADPWGAHRDALLLLAAGLDWCLRAPPGGRQAATPGALDADALVWTAALARDLPAESRRLFNAWPIARGEWLGLAQQLVRISNSAGPAAGLGWLQRPRKGHLAAALLELHRALLAQGMERSDLAGAALGAAVEQALLAAPDARSEHAAFVAAEGFPEAWLAARAVVARAFWRVIRLGDPTAWPGMAGRIGWTEATSARSAV
ncbi:MAG: hypothetical protein H6648_03230 [Caldilineae bacterium]|nr:hypothetical protein [Chloroflexota bacterium]MCB9176146.1 hypothetical protein [Caldilineae bacterium]